MDFLWYTLFDFVSALLLTTACAVALARNAVHAVLFLIIVFALSSVWLLLLGAEFIAVLLLVLYVGAIAVLFLFVLMLLNSPGQNQDIFNSYLEDDVRKGYFFASLTLFFIDSISSVSEAPVASFLWTAFIEIDTNIQSFALYFYTYNALTFLLLGFVLLLAMLGAIYLTLHHRKDLRRQVLFEQVRRTRKLLAYS